MDLSFRQPCCANVNSLRFSNPDLLGRFGLFNSDMTVTRLRGQKVSCCLDTCTMVLPYGEKAAWRERTC